MLADGTRVFLHGPAAPSKVVMLELAYSRLKKIHKYIAGQHLLGGICLSFLFVACQ